MPPTSEPATWPSRRASCWARTNVGASGGSVLVRYRLAGSRLDFAAGSSHHISTAWAGAQLGVVSTSVFGGSELHQQPDPQRVHGHRRQLLLGGGLGPAVLQRPRRERRRGDAEVLPRRRLATAHRATASLHRLWPSAHRNESFGLSPRGGLRAEACARAQLVRACRAAEARVVKRALIGVHRRQAARALIAQHREYRCGAPARMTHLRTWTGGGRFGGCPVVCMSRPRHGRIR